MTAGNASGVNDGAAALIVASEDAARRHGLTPRARVVAMVTAGVEPRIMGIGPLPATQKLLARLGMTLAEVDVIELNEAFAAQSLAVTRGLGLPDDAEHVNPHGGAISLGHPLGMSGARLAGTTLQALEALGGKRGVATMCIGVGQGIAALIERRVIPAREPGSGVADDLGHAPGTPAIGTGLILDRAGSVALGAGILRRLCGAWSRLVPRVRGRRSWHDRAILGLARHLRFLA